MNAAPAADRLPAYPASWYLFGASKDVNGKPVPRDLLGRHLVGYRTSAGQAVVLDGRCGHLGADLARGSVVGECLQCPFHHWQYGPDGRCLHIPSQNKIPPFARQTAFPVVERHGYVFIFNGPEPLFPLPFFDSASPEDHVAARPLRFFADCPWHLVNGNSFDVQHFRACHGRALVGDPVIDSPNPFARRIRLTFAVVGNSIYDRLLRRFVGARVDVSMTNWGGSMVVLTGQFQRACSRMIMYMERLDEDHCIQNVLVYARRSRLSFVLDPLSLWLRRMFTNGFMADEFRTLAGIRYNPAGLVESDRPLIEYYRWLAQLPQRRAAVRTTAHLPSAESQPLCEESVT